MALGRHKVKMEAMSHVLDKEFGPDGVFLIVFDRKAKEAGMLEYEAITNTNKADRIAVLEGYLEKLKEGKA